MIKKIWKDKKHILGLPISFTNYSISEDRLFVTVGFLNKNYEEILLYRIKDIKVKQTLGQRILGLGSILLISSDSSLPNLEIKNIRKVLEVKEMIHQLCEKQKISRRMHTTEILSDSSEYIDEDGDGIPDIYE